MTVPAIVIPSFNRWKTIVAHEAVADAVVCVAESQEDQYRRALPDRVEIVPHPDETYGLPATRQWIIDRWPNVCMIDDDVRCLRRVYPTQTRNPVLSPEEARDRIHMTALTAQELGAYFYGFNQQPNPLYYRQEQPFRFSGTCWGWCLGFNEGSGLHFPKDPNMVAEDDYVSFLNAYYHRYLFVDNRFTLVCIDTKPGGLQSFRSEKSEKETVETLMATFGADVMEPRKRANGVAYAKPMIPWSFDG